MMEFNLDQTNELLDALVMGSMLSSATALTLRSGALIRWLTAQVATVIQITKASMMMSARSLSLMISREWLTYERLSNRNKNKKQPALASDAV